MLVFSNVCLILRRNVVLRSSIKASTVSLLVPSIRSESTYVLKRRYPKNSIEGQLPGEKLKFEHLTPWSFIYDHVDPAELPKPKTHLEVILKQYVEGVGVKGEIVSLPKEIAREELLLPGYAVYASPENIDKYATKHEIDSAQMQSTKSAPVTARQLQNLLLAVFVNNDINWTLNENHIVVALRIHGIEAARESITLPSTPIEGPNPELNEKDFIVKISINNNEESKVHCRLYHWITDEADREPFNLLRFWQRPPIPIVPDDMQYLTEREHKWEKYLEQVHAQNWKPMVESSFAGMRLKQSKASEEGAEETSKVVSDQSPDSSKQL